MGNFYDVFGNKEIIGMIHLAGDTREEKVSRALKEMEIYQDEGVSGAIIENYHGGFVDVVATLEASAKRDFNLIKGINVLGNPYCSFELAKEFGAKFVQFDSVQTKDLDLEMYDELRKEYSEVLVLGGVGFKYIPDTGNPLEQDLEEAKPRCEAIITTGSGTGIETPIEKLRRYRELLGDFPFVVGAGVNLENVADQMKICDGAIVGSYFKKGNDTFRELDRGKVRGLMGIVNELNN